MKLRTISVALMALVAIAAGEPAGGDQDARRPQATAAIGAGIQPSLAPLAARTRARSVLQLMDQRRKPTSKQLMAWHAPNRRSAEGEEQGFLLMPEGLPTQFSFFLWDKREDGSGAGGMPGLGSGSGTGSSGAAGAAGVGAPGAPRAPRGPALPGAPGTPGSPGDGGDTNVIIVEPPFAPLPPIIMVLRPGDEATEDPAAEETDTDTTATPFGGGGGTPQQTPWGISRNDPEDPFVCVKYVDLAIASGTCKDAHKAPDECPRNCKECKKKIIRSLNSDSIQSAMATALTPQVPGGWTVSGGFSPRTATSVSFGGPCNGGPEQRTVMFITTFVGTNLVQRCTIWATIHDRRECECAPTFPPKPPDDDEGHGVPGPGEGGRGGGSGGGAGDLPCPVAAESVAGQVHFNALNVGEDWTLRALRAISVIH